MDRFLFHGTIKGISESKFESVNCPGWYISTSSEAENQPLEMCEPDSASRVISFKIDQHVAMIHRNTHRFELLFKNYYYPLMQVEKLFNIYIDTSNQCDVHN